MINIGGKEVKEMWIGDKKVDQVWIGSQKIYPRGSRYYNIASPRIVNERAFRRERPEYSQQANKSYILDSDLRNPTAYFDQYMIGDFNIIVDIHLVQSSTGGVNGIGLIDRNNNKKIEVKCSKTIKTKLELFQNGNLYATFTNNPQEIKSLISRNAGEEQYTKIQFSRSGSTFRVTFWTYDNKKNKFEQFSYSIEGIEGDLSLYAYAQNWERIFLYSVYGIFDF